ncbi:MAG: ATP-grasp domain-containing protein [Acidimicrobiaceae bacterium]|nr:ATP-grasp domain-containing protein [Acidimicrobiaceae bacterium]
MIVNVYGEGSSADPSHVARASQKYGGTCFVIAASEPRAIARRSLLENFGKVVVGSEAHEIAETIRQFEDLTLGIVTFAESGIELANQLSDILELPKLGSGTAEVLVDKWDQRKRLNAAWPIETKTMLLSDVLDPGALSYPVVIKPRRGAGSINTMFAHETSEFINAVREVERLGDYVVEESLIGVKDPLGPFLADNLSIESVVQRGKITVIGFSGRLPLAEPARDTGLIFPVSLPASWKSQVLEVNMRAIECLGIFQGLVHAEIKFCESGPRVIEVNARLGGGLARLMPLTLGMDPVEIAIGLSTGAEFEESSMICEPVGVAAHMYIQSPMKAIRIVTLPELRTLRGLADVFRVDRRVAPGDVLDWRNGTAGRLFDVWLYSGDIEKLHESIVRVNETVLQNTVWEFR